MGFESGLESLMKGLGTDSNLFLGFGPSSMENKIPNVGLRRFTVHELIHESNQLEGNSLSDLRGLSMVTYGQV